jgi:hypothetical protein
MAAVFVGFRSVFFPPSFRGWGEVTADRMIAGWMINKGAPSARVEVQLYIDDRFVAAAIADLPRPDVVAAGYTQDPRCGYRFKIPPLAPGTHEGRIYALHKIGTGTYRTLQLTGNPLHFSVDAGTK